MLSRDWKADAFSISGKDVMGIFDEVKNQVTTRAVMEQAGIVFNRSNMCKCPFHQDKTASMKVKPNDKKYFCFGCGEKGDAIDFVSKYYGLSPLDAAMKIAEDFSIAYDDKMRSPPKPLKREKSPAQILAEASTRTFRVLSDYLHLLKKWKRDFPPKIADDIDDRYIEAVQTIPKLEYQLDILLWGEDEEKKELLNELGKVENEIERKINEYRRNQRTADYNRQRGCEAVH